MIAETPTQPRPFDGFRPGRLWSLWDMLKTYASEWIAFGQQLGDMARAYYDRDLAHIEEGPGGEPGVCGRLNDDGRVYLRHTLEKMQERARILDLPVFAQAVKRIVGSGDFPETPQAFDYLTDTFRAEVETKLFLFVPGHRTPYFDNHGLPLHVAAEFPRAAEEIRRAGNCYAADEPTAAVFHAMRAAEIGVRRLASALGVTFSAPIELQEWQTIFNAISQKLQVIGQQPKSTERQNDLEFFGTAAAQLRFFKDGWRLRACHAGPLYSEMHAKEAIDHVRSFLVILAERLSENP